MSVKKTVTSLPVFMRKGVTQMFTPGSILGESIPHQICVLTGNAADSGIHRLHIHNGFHCYAPEDKSEKWVDKRIAKYLEEYPDFIEFKFHGDKPDSFTELKKSLAASLAELVSVQAAEMEAESTEAYAPAVPLPDDPDAVAWLKSNGKSDAKVGRELAEFEGMAKFVDGRIADKLYEDFSMRIGSIENLEVAGAGMRFRASYLAKFAHDIAQHVYWETRSRTLRDRAAMIEALVNDSHGAAVRGGWYRDVKTGEPIERNFGEMIALAHSELSEALEADRKDLMDDKLPQYHGTYVELIDNIIRTLDTLGMLRKRDAARERQAPSVGEIYVAKRDFNDARADHKPENRAGDNGKAY